MIKTLRKIKPCDVAACILAVIFAASIIGAFSYADDNTLRILLWPHAKATEVFYNIDLSFFSGLGYTAPGMGFAIGRGCLGVNFISLMFCMLACAFTSGFHGVGKVAWFGLSLIVSVTVGVFFSILRIIGSVPFAGYGQFATLHTGIGISIYLIGLILAYILTKKILGGRKHEKTE